MGCYMWDYGDHHQISGELMQRQCDFYVNLLKAGKIEGIVFLASCICDLELEAVDWTRQFIRDAGNTRLQLPTPGQRRGEPEAISHHLDADGVPDFDLDGGRTPALGEVP